MREARLPGARRDDGVSFSAAPRRQGRARRSVPWVQSARMQSVYVEHSWCMPYGP
jgi:hypothetical protein